MCVCARAHASLGTRGGGGGGVMQVTWSVTHLIIHTGFYSQLHIVYTNVHAHTHAHTELELQLAGARRGSPDGF